MPLVFRRMWCVSLISKHEDDEMYSHWENENVTNFWELLLILAPEYYFATVCFTPSKRVCIRTQLAKPLLSCNGQPSSSTEVLSI